MEIILFIKYNWISIAGVLIGLVYLYLEYKANVWMWCASILMAAFYIFIFYKTELYASMGIYIYFFIASVYGWIMWVTRNRNENTGDEIITSVSNKYILPIIIGIIAVFSFLFFILTQFNENSIFITVGDAMTTSLNIIALWMISRKWAEQWLLVIPANIISSILLFVQGDILSGILFFVFFIVSVFGYIRWKKMILPSSGN